MPYRLWAFKFVCTQPRCKRQKLTGCGVYKTVRRVLDMDGWYYMGTEYLECRLCKKKLAGWSLDILDQLDASHRSIFPAILTYRLSCDLKVVRLMRERTLGNSVTRLYNQLREQHSLTWMSRTLYYLSVCDHFVVPGAAPLRVTPPPPFLDVPSAQWLLTVHGYDVLFQLEDFKARVTSIFGSILKMDSTKKVTKKLAGTAHGTAAWATNVGNEYGQVLITVLTDSEGEGLLHMAAGLQQRYSRAGVAPPKLLYVNRDCCALMGKGKTAAMFSQWDELIVRLDVGHLIRRFARGVTTESHPLYALFLRRLSSCMLVWCADDVERLLEAKRGELKGSHITGLSDAQVLKRISLKEMARHCRRRTRGAEETERLIGELLETFIDATDTLGVRLLDRDRMQAIWQTQRRHLVCIQDPPGVSIYTNKGKDVTKGGVILPVLRCARESTSLESFHLHLNRFIPGTSASAEHFQAYLLEGLVRWNEDRAEAAAEGGGQKQTLHCYDGVAQHAINELSQKLLGCSLVKDHTRPAKYTGELIGVEYLFSQTHGDQRLESNLGKDPDVPDGTPDLFEGGEGEEDDLGELEEEDDPTMSLPDLDDHLLLVPPLRKATPPPTQPNPSQVPVVTPPDDTMEEMDTAPAASQDPEDDEYIGPDGVSGYQHVVLLAKSLLRLLEGPWISNRQIEEIMALWGNLPERDKAAVSYPERFRDRVLQGSFNNSKSSTVTGEESMKRSLPGQGSGPAQWPNTSRTVEAIFVELCHKHPAGKTVLGNRVNRWAAILGDYRRIRTMVLGSPNLNTHTRLQLFQVNKLTLTQWYNKWISSMERVALHQNRDSMTAEREESGPFHAAVWSTSPLPAPSTSSTYQLPEDRTGQATQRGRADTCQPLPPLPQPSLPTTSLSITPVSQDLPSTSTPLPPPPAGGPKVSRTTEWRRRTRLESGIKVRAHKPYEGYKCSKCGKPKTSEFGHSMYGSVRFCAATSGGQ
ncbi:uncharacterized protein [Salvelinus alpinus]|uniref:uncharacterized protein n=1 Tax=Salvelinus alpinus TaxID=8036 RepID=UPI0039FD9F7E